MNFVARRVASQFRQPEFPTMRRRRTILAPAMAMPEAAVNEDGGLVLGQENIDGDRTSS